MRAPTSWWALAFVVVTLGAQWWPGLAASWQFERNAYAAGAWWQLLTAQWVHMGNLHAAVNAMGFAVLVLAFQQLIAGSTQSLALLGGYTGVALALTLDAHCARYAGASGALHGLLAGSALALLLPGPQVAGWRTRAGRVGGLVLLGLAIKLVVQHGGANPPTPGWLGFATYYPAHEAGAVGGLVAVLLAHRLRWRRAADPGSASQ
jgi:rhomboid family GlyGly-CTERM serine protease